MAITSETAPSRAILRGDIAISGLKYRDSSPDLIAKRMIAIETGDDVNKYLAMLEKLPDGKYALHLVVHGQSGGNPAPTLAAFETFMRNLWEPSKTGIEIHDILQSVDDIHIGGDWNFTLTTALPEDEMKVRTNRLLLENAIKALLPKAWSIGAFYPEQVVNRQRSDEVFGNSQYFKRNSRRPEPSDVIAAFHCCRTLGPSDTTTVTLVKGLNPVVENSPQTVKAFQFGTGIPSENQTFLDHSIITVPVARNDAKTLYVYTNIVPAKGWCGVSRGLAGLPRGEMRDLFGSKLRDKIRDLAVDMIAVLTPTYEGSIENWNYEYDTEKECCNGVLEQFFMKLLNSPEYQCIAEELYKANDPKRFELPPFREMDQWQALVPYVKSNEQTDVSAFYRSYMHNAYSSLGSIQPHRKEGKGVKGNLTINQLANDVLTSLGQQMAGGYSITPEIFDLLSSQDIELSAIQESISDAQQREVEGEIHRLMDADTQIKDFVFLGIEVKNNSHFYSPQGLLLDTPSSLCAPRGGSLFHRGKAAASDKQIGTSAAAPDGP